VAAAALVGSEAPAPVVAAPVGLAELLLDEPQPTRKSVPTASEAMNGAGPCRWLLGLGMTNLHFHLGDGAYVCLS
jgi:hypothetical protein